MPELAASSRTSTGAPDRAVEPPCHDISRRRLFGGALAAAALPFLAGGCTSTRATDGAATRTVEDLTGHTVELSGPARRVVTIPLPAASMMVAVNGGPGVLVGMNSGSLAAMKDSYLGQAHPELLSVSTDVAGSDFAPNVESVLALEPDVVVQWGDNGASIVDPLRNAGLQVAQLTYGTQEDLEAAVTLYGQLLGKEQRSQRMVGAMHERSRRLRAALPESGESRPSVLYLRGSVDSLDVGGGASYNHFVTELVGGSNPASGINAENATINAEQLLRWDPEIILLGNFGSATPATLYSDPVLAGLRAVRERRVYKVPLGGYRWDPPSQESPLMWRWLAGLVHGTKAPGLRSEIADEYRFLYGSEPSGAQLDAILRQQTNSGSRGYVDFGH